MTKKDSVAPSVQVAGKSEQKELPRQLVSAYGLALTDPMTNATYTTRPSDEHASHWVDTQLARGYLEVVK